MIDVKIDAKGLNDLKSKINKLQELDRKVLSNEIARSAYTIDKKAKAALKSANFSHSKGGLLQHQDVTVDKAKKQAVIFNGQKYAPFIEFGTRFKKIKLDDMVALGIPKKYAEQFKASPLKKATNITAKPFFFPSVRYGFNILLDRLNKQIKNSLK